MLVVVAGEVLEGFGQGGFGHSNLGKEGGGVFGCAAEAVAVEGDGGGDVFDHGFDGRFVGFVLLQFVVHFSLSVSGLLMDMILGWGHKPRLSSMSFECLWAQVNS